MKKIAFWIVGASLVFSAAAYAAGKALAPLQNSEVTPIGAADASAVIVPARMDTTSHGLFVDVKASTLPTGAATQSTLADVKTSVEKIDDWEGSGNFADYLKAVPYLSNSGDPVVAAGDASGHAQVDVQTMPAIIGSVASDSELPAAAALTDDFATPTAPQVGAMGMLYDGSTWDMMRGDATNGALVNLGSNNDVTVTGSVTTSGTVTEANSGSIKTAVESLVTGATPFFDSSVNNADQTMKAAAGRLLSIQIYNGNAAAAWVQVFDNATPQVGTTAPTLSYYVPALGAYSAEFGSEGIAFAAAIHYAATTTTAGSGDPAAGLVLNATYK